MGGDGDKCINVPPDLIKATVKPMGVPLATEQWAGKIQAATGNELIIHRHEEIEDRKDPERVWAKATKYTTYALRGFGAFNLSVCRRLYGLELQKSLRRQANALKHRLWKSKIRTPLNNRLIDGMALVSWGAEDGRIGKKDAILLNDCYPLDSSAFDRFKVIGGKIEEHGRPPATMYMFRKMARQQSLLFAEVYGEEHLNDRMQAIERISDIHVDCPDFFAATFITETWGRMTYQYNICVAEGIRYIIGQYDEGITFDKIKRYALTPGPGGGAAWRFTPVLILIARKASGRW